jgi:hypothetical protein
MSYGSSFGTLAFASQNPKTWALEENAYERRLWASGALVTISSTDAG